MNFTEEEIAGLMELSISTYDQFHFDMLLDRTDPFLDCPIYWDTTQTVRDVVTKYRKEEVGFRKTRMDIFHFSFYITQQIKEK